MDLDDDLHTIWDEIRGREPWPIEAFLQQKQCILSFGAPRPERQLFWLQLQDRLRKTGPARLIPRLESRVTSRFPTNSTRDLLSDFLADWAESRDKSIPMLDFVKALVEESRSTLIVTRAWPQNTLTRHLKAVRHRHNLEMEFVHWTLMSWVFGDVSKWTSKEFELLGIPQNMWEREKAVEPDVPLRIFRMILLGSWFGIVPRSFLVIDNLDELLRSPFRTTKHCRLQAESLNTLLTELERWPRSTVQAVLGWSGHEEDAKLLRGLHEPLFEKVHAFRVPLAGVTSHA